MAELGSCRKTEEEADGFRALTAFPMSPSRWRGGGEEGRREGGVEGSATGVREPRPHEGEGPNGSSSAWSQTHLWQLHDDVG